MLALIIEDNLDTGQLYEDILHMEGFETESIPDGRRALARLGEIIPDLIILDLNLPYISGHYLLNEIRSDPRLEEIPVIIATANTVLADALTPTLGDRDLLLMKPFKLHDLSELAKRLLG